jgi:hypothetical protein
VRRAGKRRATPADGPTSDETAFKNSPACSSGMGTRPNDAAESALISAAWAR